MELKSTARAFKRGNRKEDKWSSLLLPCFRFYLAVCASGREQKILMCQLHTFTLSAANSRRWKGDGRTKRPWRCFQPTLNAGLVFWLWDTFDWVRRVFGAADSHWTYWSTFPHTGKLDLKLCTGLCTWAQHYIVILIEGIGSVSNLAAGDAPVNAHLCWRVTRVNLDSRSSALKNRYDITMY